ncbi:methylated-DNA--[protein]-cysteine S-methyltransferase [Catellatospora tritici]|uniref:methylated-DNA--[protein]-cysteine S-methyltransferase n=1 Tax=Catellatospora tritici TaxID=2851566 RepID=UPI001C2CFDBE|nr:methylated-DNA--[protein]-cysteine S-methyltransferase [Catellatospora tritici]MBV1849076.1 methylated-DNA--[protein]-cysteine S-methyltransferase [Catellatospora tritici]
MITIKTPFGPFSMSGDGTSVTAAAFADTPQPLLKGTPDGPVPQAAVDAARAYFDGDLDALDSVPVAWYGGTDYLQQCWKVLREVREPVTYTRLAELTGRPAAVRAAAQGCARNQIGLFVPCHRVLRTDGALGGFRWGLDVKRALLTHEATHRP